MPLVWITVNNCFCTSPQEIGALASTLFERSIVNNDDVDDATKKKDSAVLFLVDV